VINWITNIIGHKLYRSNINKVTLLEEALKLSKLWSHNKNFQSLDTGWMLEMIGRMDIDSTIKYLETWINEGVDDILSQFLFPNILRELFKNHRTKFVAIINTWKGKTKNLRLLLFSIKEMLDDIRMHYHSRLSRYNSKLNKLTTLVVNPSASALRTTNDINSIGGMIISTIEYLNSLHINSDLQVQKTCKELAELRAKLRIKKNHEGLLVCFQDGWILLQGHKYFF
jgi:hypothetical protein